MSSWRLWVPGSILSAGCLINGAVLGRKVTPVPLRGPIASVAPDSALGVAGRVQRFSPDVERVAGMSDYVSRLYYDGTHQPDFSVYVGYYDEQRQGHTIHSPKNCLPGAGWEPVEDSAMTVPTSSGDAQINRYRLARPGESAIAYYWYQGRGRVAYSEFKVKYELLRDAAVSGRTEEALVRIVVMVKNNDVASADAVARSLAGQLIDNVNKVLPTYP